MTRCVFAALLDAQTVEMFQWVLRQYELAIKQRPRAFFTDQDAAMLAAVRTAWPDATHLCVGLGPERWRGSAGASSRRVRAACA
jgi:hypothetical protein